MKTVEKISEGKNYTAVNVGSIDDMGAYSLISRCPLFSVAQRGALPRSSLTACAAAAATPNHAKRELGLNEDINAKVVA